MAKYTTILCYLLPSFQITGNDSTCTNIKTCFRCHIAKVRSCFNPPALWLAILSRLGAHKQLFHHKLITHSIGDNYSSCYVANTVNSLSRPLLSCGVCPSVRCLSRYCIVSKCVNILSNFFHHLVDPTF